jgi:Na+/melibiose symporter-like transporter
MTADAVDHDHLQSGSLQPGGHMAFLAFVFKAGMGLGAGLGLGFVGFFGYVDSAQALAPEVEQAVRVGAAWLPCLLLLVPITMMWNYPLDQQRHAAIRRGLDAQLAQGATR